MLECFGAAPISLFSFNKRSGGYLIRDTFPIIKGRHHMAIQDEAQNPGGGMTVREAGKRGGERVKAKYGTEFYEAIGRKGGEATKEKYGPSFYEVIGQKGGQKLKRKSS